MKNEQYLKLLPIERQLLSAIKSNYARLSQVEFNQFCEIYKELYGTELTKNEKNCNNCRLKALKKVGADYFEYLEWYKGRWGRRPEDPKPDKAADSNNASDSNNKEETISSEISNPENKSE